MDIHADNKRSGFSRPMCGETGQEFSTDLERRLPVRGALLHTGQPQPDIPHGVEVDCASGHCSPPYPLGPTALPRFARLIRFERATCIIVVVAPRACPCYAEPVPFTVALWSYFSTALPRESGAVFLEAFLSTLRSALALS